METNEQLIKSNASAAPEEPEVYIPFEKKPRFKLPKRFWVYVLVTVVVIGGGYAFGWYRVTKMAPTEYETSAVKRGAIKQTVTATGAVKSASEFSLNFEASGRVASVNVGKGDAVKAGQVMATLEATDYSLVADKARAALAEARANLAKAVAGATNEEIRVKEALLAETVAELSQASTTLANTRRETELNVKTAGLAVKKAEADLSAAKLEAVDSKRSKEEAITSAISTELSDVYAAAVSMATAQTDMDNILGVDNTLANDSFEYLLGAANPSTKQAAESAYKSARDAKNSLDDKLAALPADPTGEAVDSVAAYAKTALSIFSNALGKTRTLLDYTTGGGVLTLTELNSKKSTIDTDRTTVNTKLNTISSDVSSTELARIDRDSSSHSADSAVTTAEIALEQSRHELDVAKLQADTKVAADSAAVAVYTAKKDEASAALDQIKSRLRDVDRAPLEAAVSQALAASASAEEDIKKTWIVAPTDGIVTDVSLDPGELASASVKAISMLSTHYEVEADVSETDIAKIKVGQTVDITFDALGKDRHFSGSIISVNPAETVIQDIVYYKVRVTVEKDSDLVKPGMTANLTVETATKENALYLPLRAVREEKGSRYIEIIAAGKTVRRPVTLGLRGDEGMVEIVSGVSEGEEVITGIKEKK
jgi:HlyD family secretion protein